MTVSTVVDHNDYTGNGVTTSFPYTFRIFKKNDLVVTVIDLDDVLTVLSLDTQYTVTNAGGYTGGNVVLTTPLANGWKISIARELEATQETDLRNQGKFFAETHEDAFDKLTMLIQQANSAYKLSLRKPSSIANWYDALNNYIRNLRDPRDPQDAATKNYVDVLANSNLSRTLRVPEPINQLPAIEFRKNKIAAFDDNGNAIVILPPSGSASDVMIELAKGDGRKYLGKVATIAALRTTEPTYSKQWIDVEKYWADSLPAQGTYWHDADDTTSADNGGTIIVTAGGKRWKFIGTATVETYGAYGDGVHSESAAFTRCIAAEGTIRFSAPKYLIESPLQPVRSNQIFQGNGSTKLSTPNGGNIFEYVLTYREGVHYRDFGLMSEVPGTGKGFYSPSSIYMANPVMFNLNFEASLQFGIDANLVLATIRNCWFGLFGTRGASYQHIRASGQSLVGSNLTTNANYLENCRLYRSNSAYGVDVVNGFLWRLSNCYFETNANSAGPVRFSGILSVHFDTCGWERNTGVQLVKLQMDSTGTTQGVMVASFDKCQIKVDDATNTCALLSDTNNFNVAFTHCVGTSFSGKALFKVNSTSNPLQYLKAFIDNYMVGLDLFTQNNAWVPELRTNSVEYDDLVTGARLAKTISNSTRYIVSHNAGIAIQDASGKVYAEIVTTATGTQIRALSQDGSTLWKLQPPTSGSTPTAAQWTVV